VTTKEMAFDSEDPEFGRGFEAGMMTGALIETKETILANKCSVRNAEMFLRIAEFLENWRVVAEPIDDEYMEVTFYRTGG
jgi:hypothetical protein